MINYEEIRDLTENIYDIDDKNIVYNEQMAIINDERVHHPENMTDKECLAYAKTMILSHEIASNDIEAAKIKKTLAKQCLERKPNEDQLATLVVASRIFSDITDNQFLPPFYALYKDDLLNEYQNSCNIIAATAKYGEYHQKIFNEAASSVAIDTLERMLEINYKQSTLAKDDDFFDKKRPYHLSDIKTSLILDQLGKIVDKDYSNEYKVSEILSDLARKPPFQAAANRHPALAVTFTNVGKKCIEAATKSKEAAIFSGYGERLQQIAKKYQEVEEKPHSNQHTH